MKWHIRKQDIMKAAAINKHENLPTCFLNGNQIMESDSLTEDGFLSFQAESYEYFHDNTLNVSVPTATMFGVLKRYSSGKRYFQKKSNALNATSNCSITC